MSIFRGRSHIVLDVRGRIIIPAKFRRNVSPEAEETFIIIRGTRGCLYAFPLDEWIKIDDMLDQLPETLESDNLRSYISAFMIESKYDRLGRAILSKELIQMGKLDRDVLLLGVGTKIEIWNPRVWDRARRDLENGIDNRDGAEKELDLQFLEALNLVKEINQAKEDRVEEARVKLVYFTEEFYRFLLEDPNRLKQLTAEDFERLVADRLRAMGLGVAIVGGLTQKDGGIDLIAWPERVCKFPFLLAVQVKHHSVERKTTVSAVRDFYGTVTSADGSYFNLGLIVTNTSFTADAQWFANHNRKIIRLRDLKDLCRWMENDFQNKSEWREIPDIIELAPGIKVKIPKNRIWTP